MENVFARIEEQHRLIKEHDGDPTTLILSVNTFHALMDELKPKGRIEYIETKHGKLRLILRVGLPADTIIIQRGE